MAKRIKSVPMKFDEKYFGRVLLACREALGLQTRDIAQITGRSPSLVSRYENGLEPNPHIQTALDLANCYDIDIRDFYVLDE